MKIIQNQKKAYFYTILVVLCWATVSSAFKLSMRTFTPYQLLFYSITSSLIILFILLISSNKTKLIFSLTLKQYLLSILIGILNPFLYFIFLYKAYEILPAQIAQPVTYTWPITMMFFCFIFLKEKLSKYDFIAALFCYFGILILVTQGKINTISFSLTGIVIALISTVIWTVTWVLNKKIDTDPIVSLFLNFLFALPFTIVFCYYKSALSFNLNGALWAGYVGLFEMGIAYVFWLKALRYAENSARIINLTFLTPLLGLGFIQIFTGEKILFTTIIAVLLIILGLIIQNKAKAKTN